MFFKILCATFAMFACVGVLVPQVTHAQFADFLPKDLVPCGNETGTLVKNGQICTVNTCTFCHLVQLGQNLINFLIFAGIVVFVFLLVNAGFLLITSGGNTSQVAKARGMARHSIIGFVVLISAWLIVDTIMKAVYDSDGFGKPWSQLVCPAPTEGQACTSLRKTLPADGVPHAIGPGYGAGTYTVTPDGPQLTADALKSGVGNLSNNCVLPDGTSCAQAVLNEAAKQGVNPNFALALATIESGGCKNPATCTSPVGAVGVIQLMPETARGLCGAPCKNMSTADLKNYLSKPENNIPLGVKYMTEAQNSSRVKELSAGDPKKQLDYMAAYYNGGPRALNSSTSCPGKTWYECPANSGYRETRGYVANMNKKMGLPS